MTKSSPFIHTKGLREPLEEEVEPTPQEKYDHAMKLVSDVSISAGIDGKRPTIETRDEFLKAHAALSYLFADIYKLDEQ